MNKNALRIGALAAFLAVAAGAPAQVKKETGRDGTLHYSNPAEPERRPVVFASVYNALIERLAAEHGVDPDLVKCIVKVESDFNPDAVSYAGAMGLMQLMPEVARSYGVTNAFDPGQNLAAGIRHFRYLLDALAGDVTLALAAYHAGLGRVQRSGYAVPPIQSTINYVNVVTRYYYMTAPEDVGEKITRLYTRVRADGTLEIFGR
ncbi:MAG: lytic transglycosylase domain-containing protein [Spirochaetes bacterium]|nr:MAG: lytic transglycosylase domain-containing protein [Spirochaetota bacterium]